MKIVYGITRVNKGFLFEVNHLDKEFKSWLEMGPMAHKLFGYDGICTISTGPISSIRGKKSQPSIVLSETMPISGSVRVMNLHDNIERDSMIHAIVRDLEKAVSTFEATKNFTRMLDTINFGPRFLGYNEVLQPILHIIEIAEERLYPADTDRGTKDSTVTNRETFKL